MEQAEAVLRHAVVWHLVLVLAALLREGAGSVVDPLVAVDLGALLGVARGGRGNGDGSGGGSGGGSGRCDDVVDAGLRRQNRVAEVVSRELFGYAEIGG